MLKTLRQQIIGKLWGQHYRHTPQLQLIAHALQQKNIVALPLDHFAIIDLPSPHSGRHLLKQLFSMIGYSVQGQDYLPDKQNDFSWMMENDSPQSIATEVLPQVVVADFRLAEMPDEIQKIINKYTRQTAPAPLKAIQASILNNDIEKVIELFCAYLQGRDWSLPTVKEFYAVQEFNQLLAWVLIFGRKPNHFTLSIHLLNEFTNIAHFNQFIETDVGLALSHEGGVIKGGEKAGIAQSSTIDILQKVTLADGEIELPLGFVEFVYRYPVHASTEPRLWSDYFTGFVANHANRVIESLYT